MDDFIKTLLAVLLLIIIITITLILSFVFYTIFGNGSHFEGGL